MGLGKGRLLPHEQKQDASPRKTLEWRRGKNGSRLRRHLRYHLGKGKVLMERGEEIQMGRLVVLR